MLLVYRGSYFRFGLVFKKIITKTNFIFLKKQTDSNSPVSVRLSYFGEKNGSNQLVWCFPVWLGFFLFEFDLVFLVSDL